MNKIEQFCEKAAIDRLEVGSDKWRNTVAKHVVNLTEELKALTEAIDKGAKGKKKVNELAAFTSIAKLKVVYDQLVYISNLPIQEAYEELVQELEENTFTSDYDVASETVERLGFDKCEIFSSNIDGEEIYTVHRNLDNKVVQLTYREPKTLEHLMPKKKRSKYNREYKWKEGHVKNNQMGQTGGVFLLPSWEDYHKRKKELKAKKLAAQAAKGSQDNTEE